MARRFYGNAGQQYGIGADARLDFPDDSWTVSLWVNALAGSGLRYFASTANFGASNSWNLFSTGGNVFRWNSEDGAGHAADITSSQSITNGQWYHVVITRNGASDVTMYVNGESEGQDTTISTYDASTVATEMRFAARQDAAAELNGIIAGFGKWDRYFATGEVNELYQGARPQDFPSGLRVALSFDDPVATYDEVSQIALTRSATLAGVPFGWSPYRSRVRTVWLHAVEAPPAGGIDISPPVGNLTLSTTAPTSTEAHLPAPAAGNLTLSTTAPTAIEAHLPAPAAGDLTLTTTAPSVVVGADGDISIQPPSANLTLSTTAPTSTEAHLPAPSAGNLTLTTTAPDRLEAHLPAPGPGDLALTTTAPTATEAHLPAPAAGDLVLTTTAPTRTEAHAPAPSAGDLTLTTTAPTVNNSGVTLVAMDGHIWTVLYASRTWDVPYTSRTWDV